MTATGDARAEGRSIPLGPTPRVSVVVPTYNRAELIGATLDSVAEQTFEDWECLVIDDGSTDDTATIVGGYMERDPRFRYVSQSNSSASHARNRGIALARGEFVGFLDSDDLFPPDRLEWQVQSLRADPEAVLAYGDTLQSWSGDMRQGSVYLADWPRPQGWAFESLIQCSSIYSPLVRTSMLRQTGGFDTSLASAEDWDLWLTLSKLGSLLFEPRIALFYRLHSGNKSANILRNYTCAWRVVRKQLRGMPARKRLRLLLAVRRYFRRVYGRRLHAEAWQLAEGGRWSDARLRYRALLNLAPTIALRRPRLLLNVLWATLPTDREPVWRAVRRRRTTTHASTDR